ncbi:MAG: DUF1361 domain-containing protein [Ginsengibacter sp.]
MKANISGTNKILFISIFFTMLLLAIRIIHTHEYVYAFYPWNLFLALIPLASSKRLRNQTRFGWKALFYLAIWLLFFPNAPYLLTDLFHFTERDGCPPWFDLILVSSASWNGIVIATISLLQVENFLGKCLHYKMVRMMIFCFIVLCAYGVYLGRFLRFNSWDVIANPGDLAYYIKNSLIHPRQNFSTWAFTLIFSLLFGIIFFTIKGLNQEKQRN